ncbi:MAG: hypothetical protein M3N14_11225 [Bacteroidota bacterium]|nr:hypothetical protein [Bacteroidota bacterium]
MNNSSQHVDFFKKIARQQFAIMVIEDYEVDDELIYLTDTISNIYKYLHYTSFGVVEVYYALDHSISIKKLFPNEVRTFNGYENLASINSSKISIQVKPDGSVDFALDIALDHNQIRQFGILYIYDSNHHSEKVYGKDKIIKLTPIPGSDSYFAVQTFKELEEALEYYGTKMARNSNCETMKKAWFDDTRIFFKNGPEHMLRDSLTEYLKISLRNTEARPEQVVDRSHPVDIKITWSLANRLALIEIKWLGKSLYDRSKQFTKIYTENRALKGAKQLADYLDANKIQAPLHPTRGYLVIFDARRWNCNTDTISINKKNGLKYENSVINYNPVYHNERTDFSIPYRFFIEPIYI